MQSFGGFFVVNTEQAIAQTGDLFLIWDTATILLSHPYVNITICIRRATPVDVTRMLAAFRRVESATVILFPHR